MNENPTNPQDNAPQSGENSHGRYSVALVFTKLIWGGNFDIMLRNQIRYAVSDHEALGAAIEYFKEESSGYSLTCKCVINVQDPLLKDRITELEAQNKSYREALELMHNWQMNYDRTYPYRTVMNKAQQALNPKPLTNV